MYATDIGHELWNARKYLSLMCDPSKRNIEVMQITWFSTSYLKKWTPLQLSCAISELEWIRLSNSDLHRRGFIKEECDLVVIRGFVCLSVKCFRSWRCMIVGFYLIVLRGFATWSKKSDTWYKSNAAKFNQSCCCTAVASCCVYEASTSNHLFHMPDIANRLQ